MQRVLPWLNSPRSESNTYWIQYLMRGVVDWNNDFYGVCTQIEVDGLRLNLTHFLSLTLSCFFFHSLLFAHLSKFCPKPKTVWNWKIQTMICGSLTANDCGIQVNKRPQRLLFCSSSSWFFSMCVRVVLWRMSIKCSSGTRISAYNFQLSWKCLKFKINIKPFINLIPQENIHFAINAYEHFEWGTFWGASSFAQQWFSTWIVENRSTNEIEFGQMARLDFGECCRCQKFRRK